MECGNADNGMLTEAPDSTLCNAMLPSCWPSAITFPFGFHAIDDTPASPDLPELAGMSFPVDIDSNR